MLDGLPKGITFDGQVGDFLPTGVFVHVFRHPNEKPLLGFLPRFLFAPGFERIAMRGLRIQVQKKGFDPQKGLLLTMQT
ncbi:rlmN [Symbiodinium natans]|uniref:RlmN protein n=1 Tax=Symbiodinium natans TaxID=878477 RepID=A0A812RGW8_9DINO|nr:rlmN [Symbiodinium natans]